MEVKATVRAEPEGIHMLDRAGHRRAWPTHNPHLGALPDTKDERHGRGRVPGIV